MEVGKGGMQGDKWSSSSMPSSQSLQAALCTALKSEEKGGVGGKGRRTGAREDVGKRGKGWKRALPLNPTEPSASCLLA